MISINETWLCNLFSQNLNHTAKVLGSYLWLKSDFATALIKTTIDNLCEGTGIADSNVRRALKSLERVGFIKIEHKHKTSFYDIELIKKY